MHDTIQQRLDRAVEDNAREGAYRVARDIFTDPEIYWRICELNWSIKYTFGYAARGLDLRLRRQLEAADRKWR